MLRHIKHYWESNDRLIAWIITVSIGVGSLINTSKLPISGLSVSDKLLHMSAYAMLTLSWLFVYRHRKHPEMPYYILLSILLFGIILEVLQAISGTGRTADWIDVVANLTGSVIAVILFPGINKYLNRM